MADFQGLSWEAHSLHAGAHGLSVEVCQLTPPQIHASSCFMFRVIGHLSMCCLYSCSRQQICVADVTTALACKTKKCRCTIHAACSRAVRLTAGIMTNLTLQAPMLQSHLNGLHLPAHSMGAQVLSQAQASALQQQLANQQLANQQIANQQLANQHMGSLQQQVGHLAVLQLTSCQGSVHSSFQ